MNTSIKGNGNHNNNDSIAASCTAKAALSDSTNISIEDDVLAATDSDKLSNCMNELGDDLAKMNEKIDALIKKCEANNNNDDDSRFDYSELPDFEVGSEAKKAKKKAKKKESKRKAKRKNKSDAEQWVMVAPGRKRRKLKLSER